MPKRIGRTIIAIIISLSVASLPAAIGIAASAPSATEMSASAAMPDCEHHRRTAPADKTQKIADDSACMASCALHCFNYTASVFSGIVFSSPASAALKPVRTSDNVASRMGSPPFRPPRA
jgi:hypothetical protein